MASVAELKGAIAQAGEEAEQAVQMLVQAGERAEAALQFLIAVAQGSDHESLSGSLGAMGAGGRKHRRVPGPDRRRDRRGQQILRRALEPSLRTGPTPRMPQDPLNDRQAQRSPRRRAERRPAGARDHSRAQKRPRRDDRRGRGRGRTRPRGGRRHHGGPSGSSTSGAGSPARPRPASPPRPGNAGRSSRSPARTSPRSTASGRLPGEIPALVPLLDAGHLRVIGTDLATADAVVDSLLVRIVATTRPGSVRISLYDPRRLGAGLGGFHALSRPGLLTVYGVEEFKDLLGALDRDIRRIQRDVLGGGHSSLAALAMATGRRPEPWQVVIVQSPVRGFRDDEIAHLESVMHAGAACGIHVICRDAPLEPTPPDIETVAIGEDGTAAHLDDRRPAGHRRAAAARTRTRRVRARRPLGRHRTRPAALRRTRPAPLLERVVRAGHPRADRRGRRPVRTRRGPARRRPRARAGRRPAGLGQDQLPLRPDRLARRPLQPRRAGVLPPRLQGGRVVRAPRQRAYGQDVAAARPPHRREHQQRPGVRPRPAPLPRP